MANRNTQGFGLIPAGVLGGAPSTGGQSKYKIDSGYPTVFVVPRLKHHCHSVTIFVPAN